MKNRFLVYRLSHTILVVDISEIGLPNEIYPPDGKQQMAPSRRFQSWKDAEPYFQSLGADAEALEKTSTQLGSIGFGVLTTLI